MSESKPFPDFAERDLNHDSATVREEAKAEFPDFAARRRTLGIPRMTKERRERLDRMIRGEE